MVYRRHLYIGVGSFSVLKGPNPARPTSILGAGMGAIENQTYTHACTHIYTRMHMHVHAAKC